MTLKKILKLITIFYILLSNNLLFAKSPPPGTGTADVPANILIMLDNSGSMSWDLNGNERYAGSSSITRPYYLKHYDDKIYVNTQNTIKIYDNNGAYLKQIMSSGGFRSTCNSIYTSNTFDVYGDNIYLLDAGSRQIKIVNRY